MKLLCTSNSLVKGKLIEAGNVSDYPENIAKELLASQRFKLSDQPDTEKEVVFISTDEYEGDYHGNRKECKEWKEEMEAQGYTVVSPKEFAEIQNEE